MTYNPFEQDPTRPNRYIGDGLDSKQIYQLITSGTVLANSLDELLTWSISHKLSELARLVDQIGISKRAPILANIWDNYTHYAELDKGQIEYVSDEDTGTLLISDLVFYIVLHTYEQNSGVAVSDTYLEPDIAEDLIQMIAGYQPQMIGNVGRDVMTELSDLLCQAEMNPSDGVRISAREAERDITSATWAAEFLYRCTADPQYLSDLAFGGVPVSRPDTEIRTLRIRFWPSHRSR